jgi:hypothetical protein
VRKGGGGCGEGVEGVGVEGRLAKGWPGVRGQAPAYSRQTTMSLRPHVRCGGWGCKGTE